MTVYEQKKFEKIAVKEFAIQDKDIFFLIEVWRFKNLIRILINIKNRASEMQILKLSLNIYQRGETNNLAIIGQSKEIKLRPYEDMETYKVEFIKSSKNVLNIRLNVYDIYNNLLYAVNFDINEQN